MNTQKNHTQEKNKNHHEEDEPLLGGLDVKDVEQPQQTQTQTQTKRPRSPSQSNATNTDNKNRKKTNIIVNPKAKEASATTAAANAAAAAAKAAEALANIETSGKIVAFFDGGARDNQAKQKSLVVAGSGALLRDSVTDKVLTQRWDYLSNGNVPFAGFSLPPVTTNNAAEYVAVIAALVDAKQITQASELPIQLDVRGDSNLVVNQLLGAWRVKSDYLRPFYERALAEANALGKVVKPETFDNTTSEKEKERGPERTRKMSLVTFRHIRRNLNAEADTLANRAMDERASGRL